MSSMAQLSDNQRLGLHFLRDIYGVSAALSTRTHIWGGMAVDILCGAFQRDHHDLDGFVLNLRSVQGEMAALFRERGYTTSYAGAYDLLRIEKGDLHVAFNPLEIDGDLAMWRHVGEQGTVFFPADWLDPTPRAFFGVPVHISGVRFEYAIKVCPRLLNPEWHLRDKDRAALRFLKAEMERCGFDEQDVLAQIWSHTPYWVERGYPAYSGPVRPGLTTKE